MTKPPIEICVRSDVGPALLYVHTDNGSSTFVDKNAPVSARERAICRALLQHALRLLDASEPARRVAVGEPGAR
ncbi:hypothetical protein [Streptomyces sp. bgisy154]|uniref:hypothetical protein n=1 Tax=Streptomyces sp. bgisy154 TaxID=3413794 RepID=UPI003D7334E9